MDMLDGINAAMAYIEESLCQDIDFDRAAQIACVSKDSFIRLFSYTTGMTLKEYVRRRRLTLAADELRSGSAKVIDIAMKYGWVSPDAFAKAFARQHGITPTQARNSKASLKIYPPASFYIVIKGAKEMDFRLIELGETRVWGKSRQFEGEGYATREELRNIMWDAECDDVPGKICKGKWNEKGNHAYDGVWYGIWQEGKYAIAREEKDVTGTGKLDELTIPGGTYAAFKTGRGGLAWEEFPRLFEQIFDSWLPSSGYKQKGNTAIEVLHLQTDHDERQKNRYYEVLIPIEKK